MTTRFALFAALALSAGATMVLTPTVTQAAAPEVMQVDVVSPVAGDEKFGEQVTVLPNGNYIVTDPGWDDGAIVDVGAVYLYDGATNTVISTLTGTITTDQVGSGGVIVLTNGNYIVKSPLWNAKAGAVTWGDATTGASGPVGTTNSLHGTQAGDEVGDIRTTALANGNYVVTSRSWDDGLTANVGAATWGDGNGGTNGPVTTTNSLHGTQAGDAIGLGLTALTNGNYVVNSQFWDLVATANVGATTWGNGNGGTVGPVTIANSLHGTQTDDQVGSEVVTPLTNGNYTVGSPRWDNGAIANVGAATWGNGDGGTVGAVTITNSLHGTQTDDTVANRGAVALTNGNYVVQSLNWQHGTIDDAGAATWGNGDGGTVGAVATTNSLHGTHTDDMVSDDDVIALANGNYVVRVPAWDNGTTIDAGAVTWGDGDVGISGPVTTTNSLHGTQTDDGVGDGHTAALTNGNYVVQSAGWDNGGTANVGAATWGDGNGGTVGPVTTTNSLHGTQTDDYVAGFGLYVLANGNYLVNSSAWDDGTTIDAGAVTWGDGNGGTVGPVTTTNSLHGTQTDDKIGNPGIETLADGNYVVRNKSWDNGTIIDAGAATWGDGATGISGPVTTDNSLHGTQTDDMVGNGGVTILDNGNYVVTSPNWDGAVVDAGAATFGPGDGGVAGPVTATNSVTGTPPGAIKRPGSAVTSNDAVAVPTLQGRVLLMTILPTPPQAVTSLDPERFVDTRPLGETLDDQFEATGIRAADSDYKVKIGGRGQVPADAKAVVVNVTAIQPASNGFVTAHPCLTPRPLTSSLNYTAGVNLGNEIIAPLSASGELCLYSSAATHLTADVIGYIAADSPTTPTTPARFLDTRPAGDTIDDVAQAAGRVAAGTTVTLPIAGRGGVPADASAVIINVTAVQAAGIGFITVHPCLATPPNAASLNYTSDANRGNELVAQIDGTGNICLFTSADTHLTADVVGYLPAGTTLTAIDPSRLLDTRPTGETIDNQNEQAGKQPGGTQTRIPITGRAGIPADATTVVLNVTAIQPETNGFFTIHPCVTPAPNTASLNYTVGINGGNEIVTRLHANGDLCLYTSATTHLTIDVVAHTT